MVQVLKDRYGNILGSMKPEGNRENIYDKSGKRLGYFDGKKTFDIYSNFIGEGNLLVLLLKLQIIIPILSLDLWFIFKTRL